MTGKDLMEFITKNMLEGAEYEEMFVVVLVDGTWLSYDPEEDYVIHYPDPNGALNEIGRPDYISFEEAMRLREDVGT